MMEHRRLGASGVDVSALGVGTAAWGMRLMGYGKSFGKSDLEAAYVASVDGGVTWFDTAEDYGNGESERLLGEFRERDGREAAFATKHRPTADPQAAVAALEGSLQRLRVDRVDLYQLHYPPSHDRIEPFMDVLADLVGRGKVLAVGVCNFNAERMQRAIDALARHGVPLASNQVYCHLLERRAEHNGVLELCREHGVALIPYSPMANGILTGKFRSGGRSIAWMQRAYVRGNAFDPFREEPAPRRSLAHRLLARPRLLKTARLEPLFAELETVAANHHASIAQVALNWLLGMDALVLPIPGAKNARQAEDNLGAASFTLFGEERERIDRAESAIH